MQNASLRLIVRKVCLTRISTADNPPLALQRDAELVQHVEVGGSREVSQPPVVLDPADNDLHVAEAEAVAVVELVHDGHTEVIEVAAG